MATEGERQAAKLGPEAKPFGTLHEHEGRRVAFATGSVHSSSWVAAGSPPRISRSARPIRALRPKVPGSS